MHTCTEKDGRRPTRDMWREMTQGEREPLAFESERASKPSRAGARRLT